MILRGRGRKVRGHEGHFEARFWIPEKGVHVQTGFGVGDDVRLGRQRFLVAAVAVTNLAGWTS